MKISKWLVVRADGEVRIVGRQRALRLRNDEIAVPLDVSVPDAWGEVDHEQGVVIEMPPPPSIAQGKMRTAT